MFGQKPVKLCRVITVIIFILIEWAVLVILSMGVHNEKPSITTEVIQLAQFPLPVISMQLRNNFKISCVFVLFGLYGDTSELCSSHITQPTFNYGQWTGKFSPNNRTFSQNSFELKRILFKFDVIDDDIIDPGYTINIFDSTNVMLADMMYEETSGQFDFGFRNSSFDMSIFRLNRYFLGRNYTYHIQMTKHVNNIIVESIQNDFGLLPSYNTNTYISTIIYPTTKNSSYFGGTTGFLIEPSNFVVETLTEQRNKDALSVISNVLAVSSALSTCYAFLFGVRSIDPWGIVRKCLFKEATKRDFEEQLSANRNNKTDEISSLKNELTKLEILIKRYVVNINWLDKNKNKNNGDNNVAIDIVVDKKDER